MLAFFKIRFSVLSFGYGRQASILVISQSFSPIDLRRWTSISPNFSHAWEQSIRFPFQSSRESVAKGVSWVLQMDIHLPWRRGSRPWRVLPWQPALGAMSWWGAEFVEGIFSLNLLKVSVSNSQSTPLALRARLMSTIHVTMSCRKRECCNIPGPPYCVSSTGSQVARAFAGHPENHPVDNLHRHWRTEEQKNWNWKVLKLNSYLIFASNQSLFVDVSDWFNLQSDTQCICITRPLQF